MNLGSSCMRRIVVALFSLSISTAAVSQEKVVVGYFGFEPDIITNTASPNADDLAAVRMRVQLMIEDETYMSIIEHHEPLLKSVLIKTVSKYDEKLIDSASGKEQIRRECVRNLQTAMKKETGKPLIRDVIFTFMIADPL
jgi:flagellar FliL protein